MADHVTEVSASRYKSGNIVKLKRGFSELSFVYVVFSFNIFLITYFCVVSSFEPPLDHNTIVSRDHIIVLSTLSFWYLSWYAVEDFVYSFYWLSPIKILDFWTFVIYKRVVARKMRLKRRFSLFRLLNK